MNSTPYTPMTLADLNHLGDTSAPISDEERLQAFFEIQALRGKLSDAASALEAMLANEAFDLVAHLHRQRAFSLRTFGPGERTQGVLDHIRKELAEIERCPRDVREWIDVVLLAFDGAWRAGFTPEQIAEALAWKQTTNEGRVWPDWRTAQPDQAIEHDRSGEVTRAAA